MVDPQHVLVKYTSPSFLGIVYVTEHPVTDTPDEADWRDEIREEDVEITERMVEAGRYAFHLCDIGDDRDYIISSIYIAMASCAFQIS